MKTSALSDSALIRALRELVTREHSATADVVEHLAEVDARRLHVTEACASLTAYCVERLGYSQFEAAHRVTAARLVRKYSVVLELLRSGALSLSTLRTVAPVLDEANHRERLAAVVGRTRNEVERMVAGWAPKPDVPTRIVPLKVIDEPVLLQRMTALADTAHDGTFAVVEASLAEAHAPLAAATPVARCATPSPPPRPAPLPKPLTPERFSLQVTIDAETYEDLMRVRDHLRHAIPDGDVAKIIKRAVKELRTTVEARKFGKRKTKDAESVTAKAATAKPETIRSGIAEPGTAEPTTAKPGTASPRTAERRTAERRTAEPGTAEPRAAKPGTAKPGTAEPTTAKPRTASPRTAEPGTADLLSDVRHPSSDVRASISDARSSTSEIRLAPLAAAQEELFLSPIIDEGESMPRAPGRAIRRDVAERDNYQCCYVSNDGHRCSSTAWIEYDHSLEWANNGPTWAANMQLLCRTHNQAKQRAADPSQKTTA